MDPVPIAISVSLLTVTTVIVVLSIQVWGILKELKESIIKTNKMLDDTGRITETVGNGVEGLSGVISGIQSVSGIISAFRRKGVTHV